MAAEIPLSSRKHLGLVALVDDEDYEAVTKHSWSPTKTSRRGARWYAESRIKGRIIRLHNFVCSLHGLPEGPDHINGSGLDNRKQNLRPATLSQNGANRGLPLNNTSGFKGVSWHKAATKWQAYITIDGHRKYLGLFPDPEQGARAYDRAALEHFGEFACLNFPAQGVSASARAAAGTA